MVSTVSSGLNALYFSSITPSPNPENITTFQSFHLRTALSQNLADAPAKLFMNVLPILVSCLNLNFSTYPRALVVCVHVSAPQPDCSFPANEYIFTLYSQCAQHGYCSINIYCIVLDKSKAFQSDCFEGLNCMLIYVTFAQNYPHLYTMKVLQLLVIQCRFQTTLSILMISAY